MSSYVLDTNIITSVLRPDKDIENRYLKVLSDGHTFIGCPVVYYEVKRGLLAQDNRRKMALFESMFYDVFEWRDYTKNDWILASGLWAKRKTLGRPIEDADLFIAVFALNNNATIVTNNTKDFAELGVTLEDWTI